MKKLIAAGLSIAGCPMCACAGIETLAELDVSGNVAVSVEAGDVKRIEYISGTAAADIVKEGDGTLEVAIVGNTNATFRVNGGRLKFVRPGRLALGLEEAAFHADGSDSAAMDVEESGGTNFVTKIRDADGRSTYAVKYGSRPNPYLTPDALNGLAVFDFGSMYGSGATGYGAAMAWSEIHLPNELFYVWCDHPQAKHSASANSIGPTPVNLQYSGYRGKGGAGADFMLLNTCPDRMGANLHVDDVKSSQSSLPGDGWHLLRNYASQMWVFSDSNTNSYSARGFGYRPNGPSPYGGFRLAEMIICTNRLTAAKREYVNHYLKRKWFGGYPVKGVLLAKGTEMDVSEAPVTVGFLQLMDSARIAGEANLRLSESSGASSNLVVSAAYSAASGSAVPNLGFEGDGEVSVAAGSASLNIAEGSGVFSKSGAGRLTVGHLSGGFCSVEVKGGELELDPLKTPASSFHVDASDDSAFEIETVGGTNFVNRWDDVLRNGQGLVKTSRTYPFDSSRKIGRPFRVAGRLNGMPMVDFGTIADSERNGGNGAMMEVVRPIGRSGPAPYRDNPTSRQGLYQIFTVWEDDPDLIDAPYFEYGGETKPFVGPVLFGGGYSWYRGAGGNGTGFPFCAMRGPATVREYMYLDGNRFYSENVRFTPVGKGAHIMDQRIGWSDTESTALQFVGGNLDVSTTNGPYAANGVFGGARFAEVMAFRYYLPAAQRAQIRNALGVKWFGTEKYALEYAFGDVSVSQGAALSMPYADVSVTNLAIAGSLSARSVAVEKSLVIAGDSAVPAPVSLKPGATVSLRGREDGFFELQADSVALGDRGTVAISDWEGVVCGQSFRIIKSSSVSGAASAWKARRPDGAMKAHLEAKADGIYVTFVSGGTKIIVR